MRPLLTILLLLAAIPQGAAHTQPTPAGPLSAVPPGAAQVAAQAGRDLAALRDAERRRADAVANRDVDAMRNLIASDYYHVETNGRLRTRSEFLQLLARDEFEFRSYEIVNMEIQLADSGRVAVVRGRFIARMQATYRTPEFRGRYVRIWQLGPDGWRNTMMQSTEIKPAR